MTASACRVNAFSERELVGEPDSNKLGKRTKNRSDKSAAGSDINLRLRSGGVLSRSRVRWFRLQYFDLSINLRRVERRIDELLLLRRRPILLLSIIRKACAV